MIKLGEALMKNKQKTNNFINLVVSGILILLGLLLLIFPWFGIKDPTHLLYILFGIYGVIKLFEYFFTKAGSDREDLYTGIVCLLAMISAFLFSSYNQALVLGITLVSWVAVMALIKLIKLDFYHDRHHKMFYVNLTTFLVFLIIGVLTSINLYFDLTVQTLVLGYFFVINGLINLAEDSMRIINSELMMKSDKK